MALFRYPGIFSKTAVFAIVILALAVVTPVAASSVSNSNFWDYGGIAYGYSVNLQSTSTYPVIGNFGNLGISVSLFSPVPAGSGYRDNYLPVNPVPTQSFFKKLNYEYSGNPQMSLPVPDYYPLSFSNANGIHTVTSIDYVDVSNQRVHVES